MFSKMIKDFCTLANGEDFCLAGVATLLAIAIGLITMIYVFAIVRPSTSADISEILKAYGMYHGAVITSGCTGKLLTNKSEPNQ